MNRFFPFSDNLPKELSFLADQLIEAATNLQWTWSHAGDSFWESIDPIVWGISRNPYAILQKLTLPRLHELANDTGFVRRLENMSRVREDYLHRHCWADNIFSDKEKSQIAYFSMEFGLGEALPLYAGGLGVLAGDYLKAASDLGVPLVGIGLMYDEGYFRQILDASGEQQAIYAYNDSRNLPLQPVITEQGGWLSIPIDLPGRLVYFQVWQATVGRVMLYLLDSNDPLNSPVDQGITGQLYGGSKELRLIQEMVLGIGGWRIIEALGLPVSVCHMNEGHAAFAAMERARCYQQKHHLDFCQALWATRAGNIFTTHTPLAAAFDTYSPELLIQYGQNFADSSGLSQNALLSLGRKNPGDSSEAFNMAYLAARTCARINGVSHLHAEVSRRLFQPLYPSWPEQQVPIGHITNGIHVPSWDSPHADQIWTDKCGKERWLGSEKRLYEAIMKLTDKDIWSFKGAERADLVAYVRKRLARQLRQRGVGPQSHELAHSILDSNVLTIGFARRFVEYKRPNLLLHDAENLVRLLNDSERPVQIIIAGKAHPQDNRGKQLIRQWTDFVRRIDVRQHVVFLEDYDIRMAQELVQGVDVWLNTPRRPWEACGTSGMKILANGGINVSELDGWWAEAYKPELGWALGDGREHSDPGWDATTAQQLYHLLETEIIPEFYDRDEEGIPRQWVRRMRLGMAELAPQFSSNRMLREYVETLYLPAQQAFRQRTNLESEGAKSLALWQEKTRAYWRNIHWGNCRVLPQGELVRVEVQLYLADIGPDDVQVQLFADASPEQEKPTVVEMQREKSIVGSANGYVYEASLHWSRPYTDFTPRVIAFHPAALIPSESNLISWWVGERQVIEDQGS